MNNMEKQAFLQGYRDMMQKKAEDPVVPVVPAVTPAVTPAVGGGMSPQMLASLIGGGAGALGGGILGGTGAVSITGDPYQDALILGLGGGAAGGGAGYAGAEYGPQAVDWAKAQYAGLGQ